MTRSIVLAVTWTLAALALPGPVSGADLSSQELVDKALVAVGGKERLLRRFKIGEIFHFGDQPEPPAGKKRSTRTSVIELPNLWWIGKKERGEEPAKEDVRAWSLDLLVDPKSRIEIIEPLHDEGKVFPGLQVSESVVPPMKFYFDPDTHLLHRLDWRSDFYRFGDWKEQDGLRYAAKTTIFKLKDGKPWFYHDITSIERLDALPEGLAKP